MVALIKSASLFEVNVADYKQLNACRKEVGQLKELWDMILLVKGNMDDWKTTLWRDINVDDMDMDTKKYAKDIKGLDKEMRAWDAFTGLDSMVKNMMTSLRAVGDLQNPAVRERHWLQLMMATKVHCFGSFISMRNLETIILEGFPISALVMHSKKHDLIHVGCVTIACVCLSG